MSADQTLTPAPVPQRPGALFQKLAGERKALSQGEKDAIADASAFTFVDRTWVTLWYDPAHAIRSKCGGMTAFRAITTTGDLLWYVAPEGDAPVYHAQCADPFEAIEHATVALGAQADLNRRWAHIERLAEDLRSGAVAFDVTLEDARRVPIRPTMFKALMAAMSLFGKRTVSGRNAAMLMKAEPSIGFIIHAAWIRSHIADPAQNGVVVAPRRPVSFEAIC
ncbi:hypothetical protein ACERZ8_14090 [Tateyamaria armeniaca]|uniref:Uncharacterized protein n=1 Tax=Tateyamaria armeniaca TaxID=2518930 RepID=A0ABW8UUX9_9RHOB